MTLRIPLDPVPNQELTVRLDNHRYVIALRDIGGMMAVTITRDDVVLISGVRACAGSPLLPYFHLVGMFGSFIFTTVAPGEIPYYPAFGSTCFLAFATTDEILAA